VNMKKWISRKLFVAVAGTAVLGALASKGVITWDDAASRMRDLWVAWMAAQGATDVMRSRNMKEAPDAPSVPAGPGGAGNPAE